MVHSIRSVSAFAPICNPSVSPWGIKALTGYLGPNHENWSEYDSVLLLSKGAVRKYDEILIDVGTDDSFLKAGQLLPEVFLIIVCEQYLFLYTIHA